MDEAYCGLHKFLSRVSLINQVWLILRHYHIVSKIYDNRKITKSINKTTNTPPDNKTQEVLEVINIKHERAHTQGKVQEV